MRAGAAGALGNGADSSLQDLLERAYSARHVVLTDSGTSALALALAPFARRNELIALPAYGCYDLATAASAAKANVVLYDLDPATLAPDVHSLQRALAAGARAIVAVHLYGLPIDIQPIRKLSARAGAVVIEDAAQAVGASLRGAPAGSLGALSILSFGRGKGISGGRGGALLVHDDDSVESLLEASAALNTEVVAGWSDLGRAVAQWAFGRPFTYGAVAAVPFLRLGETIYHPPRPLRPLSRAAGRIVYDIWRDAQQHAEIRRQHAELLLAAARGADWQTIAVLPESIPGYLRLPLIPRAARRLNAADVAAGVMPGYPLPLSRLNAFRARCVNVHEDFLGAQFLADKLITAPTHQLLTNRDMQNLRQWLSAGGSV